MGEIANMILDGTLCVHCGSFIDFDYVGYPRSCGCDGNALNDAGLDYDDNDDDDDDDDDDGEFVPCFIDKD